MKIYIYILLFSVGVFASAQGNHTQTKAIDTSTVQAKRVANPNAPEIVFTETIHDFGILKKGTSVNCRFTFKNTGKEALILHDCRSGCRCTSAKCSKEPILPGKTGFIDVHYDSTLVGTFMKELLISSNAKTPVIFLSIKGAIEDENAKEVMPAKDEEIMKSGNKKAQ